LVLQVLIPKGAYKGQNDTTLVKTKMPARTNNTMPKVPVITLVKYKIPMTTATIILATLSVLPMFAFISYNLKVNK
jgi:hypothetical protein